MCIVIPCTSSAILKTVRVRLFVIERLFPTGDSKYCIYIYIYRHQNYLYIYIYSCTYGCILTHTSWLKVKELTPCHLKRVSLIGGVLSTRTPCSHVAITVAVWCCSALVQYLYRNMQYLRVQLHNICIYIYIYTYHMYVYYMYTVYVFTNITTYIYIYRYVKSC